MLFFVGWPKLVPLKNSVVVDIQHNLTKIWTAVLTKNRLSIWTFSLNENILLGYLTRCDLLKYGENLKVIWCYDSRKIAVVTSSLCVYLYKIEELKNNYVINSSNSNNDSHKLIPKVKKIKIIPFKLLNIMKLPQLSTVTNVCSLNHNIFIIATNHSQFIHIHWKGHVEV